MMRNRTANTTGTGKEAEMKEAEYEVRGIRDDRQKYDFV
jgi:hypothetical protein